QSRNRDWTSAVFGPYALKGGKTGGKRMLIRHGSDIRPSEITPRDVYLRRREFLAGAAALGVGTMLPHGPSIAAPLSFGKSALSQRKRRRRLKYVTSYTNYNESGPGKGAPAENADRLKTRPWSIVVDGLVDKPTHIDIEDLIRDSALEERIYRMRCVEAWSM